jgi:hypothetical protein
MLQEMKARQTAIEWAMKKIIAGDMDVDINDPEEQQRIENRFKKVIAAPQSAYFGD